MSKKTVQTMFDSAGKYEPPEPIEFREFYPKGDIVGKDICIEAMRDHHDDTYDEDQVIIDLTMKDGTQWACSFSWEVVIKRLRAVKEADGFPIRARIVEPTDGNAWYTLEAPTE